MRAGVSLYPGLALPNAVLLSLPQLDPATGSRPAVPDSFAKLDDIASDPASRGFVHVQAPPSVLSAASRHLERRAREAGRTALTIGAIPTDDAWRELSARLGVAASVDPLE